MVDFFLSVNIWHIISFCAGCMFGWITKVPYIYSWYREIKETDDYKKRKSDAYKEEIQQIREQYRKW